MKKIFILYIILLFIPSVVGAREITTERVYITLDKDCYLAGEEIWVKFSVYDSLLQPSSLSKVGYIEISDTRKPYIQHILSLKNGKGSAMLKIPGTTPSGVYQLTGYTRFMRNEGPKVFFTMPVAVINTLQSSDDDRMEVTDANIYADMQKKDTYNPISLSTDKTQYAKRDRVEIKLNHIPADIVDMSISVSRNDSVCHIPAYQFTPASASHAESFWLPEYEGHIITGQAVSLVDGQVAPLSPASSIGFLGRDIKYTQGKPLGNGQVLYVLGNVYGQQQIVTTAEPGNGNTYRMDLLPPYVGVLPANLPVLEVPADNKYLEDRSVGMQINRLLTGEEEPENSFPADDYYNLRPTISYDLDEYTRFNTMGQTFIEFVNRLSVRTVDGKRRIRILREEDGKYNVGNTLVLLDGIPVYDHEDIINYNPHNIRKIHIYGGKYVFGGQDYTCMVSFITHRENLPAFQLGNGAQLMTYECPHLPVSFTVPDYSNDSIRNSRNPDLRHTLYWNPCLEAVHNTGSVLTLYTSDLTGEFKVEVQALTREGKKVTGTALFTVRQ